MYFFSHRLFAGAKPDTENRGNRRTGTLCYNVKTPEINPDGYESTSILRQAKNLHGRLLLVHGTYDDNVHPQNAWSFIEELVQANIPFDMMFYPMRKHGIIDRAARIHLFNKMLEFWGDNL